MLSIPPGGANKLPALNLVQSSLVARRVARVLMGSCW
jgi:hypothetical protein